MMYCQVGLESPVYLKSSLTEQAFGVSQMGRPAVVVYSQVGFTLQELA